MKINATSAHFYSIWNFNPPCIQHGSPTQTYFISSTLCFDPCSIWLMLVVIEINGTQGCFVELENVNHQPRYYQTSTLSHYYISRFLNSFEASWFLLEILPSSRHSFSVQRKPLAIFVVVILRYLVSLSLVTIHGALFSFLIFLISRT